MRVNRGVLSVIVAGAVIVRLPVAETRGGQVDGVMLAPQPPTAQGQVRDRAPVRRTGTAALSGRVVDGATGAAIPRARVRLSGSAGPQPPGLTDANGAFSFKDLPSGVYFVSVEKVTYMTADYPDSSRSLRGVNARPLVLRDGQLVDDVVVPIYRGGAITGRVLDAHGDPVEFAEVRALKTTGSGATASASTNDLGEFRFARLEAGQYLLMVHSQRQRGEDVPGAAPAAVLQSQPLPTFYPNTVSRSDALPIAVERGQTVSGIDVMMAEGAPTVVSGVVLVGSGQPLAMKGGGGSVTARMLLGRDVGAGWIGGGAQIRPDGTFRLPLAPGDYVIEAHVSVPQDPAGSVRSANQLTGLMNVTVSGEAMDLSIVVGTGATAAGRVVFEGTTPAPAAPQGQREGAPMQSPDGGNCRSGRVQIDADWTFKIGGLSGTCGAPSFANFGRWMLKAVIIDGQDVTRETVTFQQGQHYDKVQVVVTDRRLELSLRVADEKGERTRDYVALVFPTDRRRWHDDDPAMRHYAPPLREMIEALRSVGAILPASQTVAAALALERETLLGLRPGDYYAIAIDDIDADSARDPAVLERLASSATRVSLDEGATEVALRRLRLADVIR